MEYALAKQLKDAGFNRHRTEECFKDHEHSPIGSEPCSYFPVPTLSELIEACGKDVWINIWGANDESWGAEIKSDKLLAEGKTPEEAVAKLWLKLN
jgi:hypothetical protein